MATAAAAARSIFRSSSVRSAAARASSQAKSAPSPFRIGSQNSLSNRIFRCPAEMSACLESMQPFHTFSIDDFNAYPFSTWLRLAS